MVDSEENYKFDLGVKGLNLLPYGTLVSTSPITRLHNKNARQEKKNDNNA